MVDKIMAENNIKKKVVKTSGQNGIFVDVFRHPIVQRWMSELANNDPDAFCRLIENNRDRFRKKFGDATWKNTKKNVNPEEQWEEGWAVSKLGLNWLFLTGDLSGTIIKIQMAISEEEFISNAKMGVGATAYLEDIKTYLIGG